ncbi:MAG: hypothetical protein LBJ96_00275 [Holosporaceae bacterium]|nr:hypothetical protein [Holosporaceae bacterium]
MLPKSSFRENLVLKTRNCFGNFSRKASREMLNSGAAPKKVMIGKVFVFP